MKLTSKLNFLSELTSKLKILIELTSKFKFLEFQPQTLLEIFKNCETLQKFKDLALKIKVSLHVPCQHP